MNRRQFFATTGAAALSTITSTGSFAEAQVEKGSLNPVQLRTGNGEWTYDVVSHWGELPAGKTFGGTHGGIATDKGGLLYVSTQSDTGVLVYDRDGRLLRTIATEYPEIHSMFHAEENGARGLLHYSPKRNTEGELAFSQNENGWNGRAEDHGSIRCWISDAECMATDRRCARTGSLHLHRQWIWRLSHLQV